jgi:hypothetical protein
MLRTIQMSTLAVAGIVVASWAAADPPPAAVAPATHVETIDDDDGRFDQTRLVRELMRRRGGDPAATAHLIQLTRQFEPAVAAEMFNELATAHLAAGNLDLAAETRRTLVQQYPNEPAAAEATLWLVRVYASSEVAHAARRRSGASASESELIEADEGLAMYALSMAGELQAAPVEGNSQKPAPELAYERYVAARRAGLAKAADGFLTSLKRLRADDAWGNCARAEAWLAESRDEPPPKSAAHCTPATEPPHLDGVLDEACWQASGQLFIGSHSYDVSPSVRLAYDGEFLYLACECPHAVNVDYSADDRPRPHDGDLSQRDRVTLVLDADRDYATGWELTVDSRGWTGDRCWDDAAWNPEWFVAAGPSPDGSSPEGPLTLDPVWIVEAAIPWSELAIRPPTAGEAWACAVRRQIPGAEAESWQGDAAEASNPAQFGLLLFD